MSTYIDLSDILKPDDVVYNTPVISEELVNTSSSSPFDVSQFINELRTKSEEKNKAYMEMSNSISGYDIAHNCIGHTVKKLLNYPIENYASSWLPIHFRSVMGTAIHDFIQEFTNQFTEVEPSIKIPSINFSGRIDALISDNILVEIKSCSYDDYKTILKTRQPRKADFYQTMVYKYVLENYLEEAKSGKVKTRTQPPKLNKYKIDTIQFIYVCHQLVCSDIESLSLDNKMAIEIKKQLSSKHNPFFFITELTIDLNEFDPEPYINWIKSKIDAINGYVQNNKLPTNEDPFVDLKKCFFCPYTNCCELK